MTARTGYSPPLLARSWHEIGPLPARGHPPGAISGHVAAQALSTGWWIYLAQAYELAELRTVRLVRVRALPRRRGGQCRLRERLDLCRKAALASRRSTIRPWDYAGPSYRWPTLLPDATRRAVGAGAPPDGLGASPRPARTPTRGVPLVGTFASSPSRLCGGRPAAVRRLPRWDRPIKTIMRRATATLASRLLMPP